jgi:hypothetical protein
MKCHLHRFPAILLLSLSLKNATVHAAVGLQQEPAGFDAIGEVLEDVSAWAGHFKRVFQVDAFQLAVRRESLIADAIAGLVDVSLLHISVSCTHAMGHRD